MEELFVIEDLLNVLIELEAKGNLFYDALSKKAGDEEVIKLFSALAEAEETHKVFYEGIKEKQNENKNTDYIDEEYKKYLDVLINNNFIVKAIPEEVSTIGEAIAIAETLEKETILFLNELINIMPSEIELMKILSEEKKHLEKVLLYKRSSTSKGVI